MMMQFDGVQAFSKDGMGAAMKAFGSVSQSTQAIAVEVADYAKKSVEQGTAALERLSSARTLEKATEIQTEYLRGAYEGFVAGANRVGALYANLAKDAMKPCEALAAGRAPRA